VVRRRVPEGIAGVDELHAIIAAHLPEEWADLEPGAAQAEVKVGIETDRGPWVAALVAVGYEVYAINPLSVARYRGRHSTSGAKSDAADAHLLAEIVRIDRAHHRRLAGESEKAEGDQAGRTHSSEPDLGPHPSCAAAALSAAGVLPHRIEGVSRPGRPGVTRAAGQGTRPRPRHPVDQGADHRGTAPGQAPRRGGQGRKHQAGPKARTSWTGPHR
jgi:hypothetical protein